jgi:mRNA-degrading endonuclease toxin of MazEF toxin-antitoxin module
MSLGSDPEYGYIYLLKRDSVGKSRPIVVVSNNTLNRGDSILAVPFYSRQLEKRKKQQWCAFYSTGEGGLDRDCVAKADELTLVDKLDIDLVAGKVGGFNDDQMKRLISAIKWSLNMK